MLASYFRILIRFLRAKPIRLKMRKDWLLAYWRNAFQVFRFFLFASECHCEWLSASECRAGQSHGVPGGTQITAWKSYVLFGPDVIFNGIIVLIKVDLQRARVGGVSIDERPWRHWRRHTEGGLDPRRGDESICQSLSPPTGNEIDLDPEPFAMQIISGSFSRF